MGLLNPENNGVAGGGGFLDPRTYGLLGAAGAMLEASGPSRMPVSFGQIMGRGLLTGMQAQQQAQTFRDATELKELQIAEARRVAAERARQQQIQSWALSQLGFAPPPGAPGAIPPNVQQRPGMPQPGMPQAPGTVNPGMQGPQPQAPLRPTGPMGSFLPAGVSPTAAMLALSGDPTLGKIGGWAQDAQKPTDKMREAVALGYQPGTPQFNAFVGTQFTQGGAWQPDGAGGVRLAPGYAQGMGAVKGAEAGASAAYDFVEVPVPGGGTQMMPKSEASRRLMPSPVSRETLSDLSTARGANALSDPRPYGNTSGPVSSGGGLGYRRPVAQTEADKKFSETLSGEMAKTYSDLLRADFNAPSSIAKYDRLGSLLANVNTGRFTGTTTDIKAAAKSLGFDLQALGIGDDVAPAQAARALSNQLALELRNPAGGAGMPGAMSDSDRRFLEGMVPSLENDPNAIPMMIDFRKRLAQREQQVAKMARAYKKRTGGFDDGFYEDLSSWSAGNPMFREADIKKARPANNNGFRVLGPEGD